MSVSKALALNTTVQIIGKILSTILGVAIVGILGRHLGTEGFGMYSTANAFFQFFAIVLDLGLNITLVQMLGERAQDSAYENKLVSAAFTLRFVSALILLGLAPCLGMFFPYAPELKMALFAIWGSFFATALNQIVIGVHQKHLTMHVVAASEIAGRLILFLGTLYASFHHWGLVPIVLLVSLGSTVQFFINFYLARRLTSFSWNWDLPFWMEILRRSWPIGVSILFSLIYFKADTLILSLVRPQTEVGLYGAAYRVLEVASAVPFMYAGVMLPVVSHAWSSQRLDIFRTIFSRSLDAMVMLAAPLVSGTLVLATRGLTMIFNSTYEPAGDVLRILIVATGIIFFGTISSHVIVALKLQSRMLPIYVFTALFTLIGYLILIPRYGMWAAAWLTVASEACVAIGSTWISLRHSSTNWNPRTAFKAGASAVIMGLVIYPCRQAALFIPVFLGAAVYISLLFVTGAMTTGMLRDLLKPTPSESASNNTPLC